MGPLKEPEGERGKWFMSLLSQDYDDGLVYPMFRWNFGESPDAPEAQIYAWPLAKPILFFYDVATRKEWRFYALDPLLAQLEKRGWGEPPHIREIFRDMPEDVPTQEHLNNLRTKWKKLIGKSKAPSAAQGPKNSAWAKGGYWDRQFTNVELDPNKLQ